MICHYLTAVVILLCLPLSYYVSCTKFRTSFVYQLVQIGLSCHLRRYTPFLIV